MAKKLLQEVMEEIKLTEKKLGKSLRLFEEYSVITHIDRPTIGYPDKDRNKKFDLDLAAKSMGAELDSYKDLVDRLAALKKARDNANMNTTLPVEWNGKKLSIYDAIQMKRSIAQHLRNMYNRVEECKQGIEGKSDNIFTKRVMSNKSQDKSDLEIHNLLPVKEIEEEAKKFEEMMSNIDAKITIANATTEVEV